jgi:hypothetical protein
MKLALDTWQELPEGTIHTIPVRLDDCDVPEDFRRYHWANLFEPNGFDRVVRAIRAELAKRQKAEKALSTFTNSIGMEFVQAFQGPPVLSSVLLSCRATQDARISARDTVAVAAVSRCIL